LIEGNALPARRHQELLQLTRERGQITVHELSSHFQISLDTVRRDLDHLARQGLLTRTHGGAVISGSPSACGSAQSERRGTQRSEIERIARAAHGLIKDGETLIVNGGSTTKAFAEKLDRCDLTVVTNSLSLLAALPTDCCRGVYLIGGRYDREAHVTVGPVLVSGMDITVDCAVVGVDGVTAKEGLTLTVLEEALMTSAMIAAARTTVVLADHSKVGNASFAHVCALESIHALVTDEEPRGDLAGALKEARVEVIIAPEK
jgi:DeoR/GlpR family transcriptional regulator of sugar metabolism